MLIIEQRDLQWWSMGKFFTADASALEEKYPIHRLDYENGEWFFHVRSARTGKLAKFVRENEEYAHGKLNAVRFVCEEHKTFIRIYNDEKVA